ncbi:MAG: hypothetical protein P8I93_01935 [Crocinitomicaceae bacterium]|nr:hypothetical protein [Crocinitomicaceae bacterium]
MRLLFVFVFLLGLASCGEDATKNVKKSVRSNIVDNRKNAFTLKDYNLSENIDSVHRVRSYPFINKDFMIYSNDSLKLPIYNSYHFNKEGQLFKTKYYTSDSSINLNEFHLISENGKLIDFKQESFPEDGYSDSVILNTESNFNQVLNFSDTLNAKHYLFFESDRFTKDSTVYSNGEIEVNKYGYDDKRLQVNRVQEFYYSDGLTEKQIDYSYKYLDFDELGNWTKRIEYLQIFNSDSYTESTINCMLEERTIFFNK